MRAGVSLAYRGLALVKETPRISIDKLSCNCFVVRAGLTSRLSHSASQLWLGLLSWARLEQLHQCQHAVMCGLVQFVHAKEMLK